jgi:hypothetical protein
MLLGKKIKWGIKPASSKEHITYDLQTQCYEYDAAPNDDESNTK